MGQGERWDEGGGGSSVEHPRRSPSAGVETTDSPATSPCAPSPSFPTPRSLNLGSVKDEGTQTASLAVPAPVVTGTVVANNIPAEEVRWARWRLELPLLE